MENITKSQLLEIIKANNDVAYSCVKLNEAKTKLWEIERKYNDAYYDGVKLEYLKDIYSKYDEKNILNCFGDIFFIDERDGYEYEGRRVLWNLSLSNESYHINEYIELDENGCLVAHDYEINVIYKEL